MRYTHVLKNSSLNFIKHSKLRMEIKEWKKHKKGFRTFYKNKAYNHQIDSTDLLNNICFGYDFKINKQKDVFELSINYIDTSLTIPCRLTKRRTPLAEQKANLKFWKKLQKVKLKEKKENKKVIDKYSNAMNEYETVLKKYQEVYRDFIEVNKAFFTAQEKVSYALQLNAFRVWNCDRFGRRNRGVKIKAAFKKLSNSVFIPVTIYIINKTKNGFERQGGRNSFTYEKGCNHSLLLVDAEGNMGGSKSR